MPKTTIAAALSVTGRRRTLHTLCTSLLTAATLVGVAGCSHGASVGSSDLTNSSNGSEGSATIGEGQDGATPGPEPTQKRFEVVNTFEHDPSRFTQGLEFHNGQLYESTGQYGTSAVFRRSLADNSDSASAQLPSTRFGEGLTITDTSLWHLTWKAGVAYERDPTSLEERRTVPYSGEGWGLCARNESDGRLVMSNGSETLSFRDPETFDELSTITVTNAGRPQKNLNELECVGDSVYANIWQSETIVRIDTQTGHVIETIDASALPSQRPQDVDAVLNGIAAVEGKDTFIVTGKYWPRMFEVRVVD